MAIQSSRTADQEMISAVQEIAQYCLDSAKGYRVAADQIDDENIASAFRRIAERRDNFVLELKDVIRQSGGDADVSQTIKGRLHQWWLEVRGTVTGGDRTNVLKEAERGENTLAEKYEELLPDAAGIAGMDVLNHQAAAVHETRDELVRLRERVESMDN